MAEGERDQGTELIATGLGIGAFGAISAALLGAVCPICIVATPALVGAGLYKRWGAAPRAPPGGGGGE